MSTVVATFEYFEERKVKKKRFVFMSKKKQQTNNLHLLMYIFHINRI